jgi:eukaryotic-like serine/threonine-protein kinase
MNRRRTKTDPERWAAASAHFDALCELDADEQARRLADIAQSDAALAAEVRALLDADADDNDLFDGGLAARADTVRASLATQGLAPKQPGGWAQGVVLGPYTLDERIGQGGMGEVWRATRAAPDAHGPVALKLLRPGMDSEDLVRRFALERRILERLEHPGIARLLDAGTATNGQPWLAVEYIDGIAIDRYAREHALDVNARVALIAAVCDAVDFAHRRLIVHRDLKPANVLVDAQRRTHLLDFGIAKLLAEEAGAERLTQTGVRAFSPAYAAPEQLMNEPVTTSTDVYALGLVLFELLTGQLPHQRTQRARITAPRDPMRETIDAPSQVLRRASASQIEAAYGSSADARDKHVRAIAGDLDTIVLTALRREPERRYASATALADDLRRLLDGMPINARRDSWRYRSRMFLRRNRVGVAGAALIVLSLIGGIAATTWQARVAQREAVRADSEARAARAAAARAQSTREALVAMFRASGPDQFGNPTISVHEILQEGRRAVEESDADPLVRADLAEALARVHLASGMAGEALRLARESIRLRDDVGTGDDDDLRMARVTLARALSAAGEKAEALSLLTSLAQGVREHPVASAGELQIRMAVELATPLAQLDRYPEADALLDYAATVAQSHAIATHWASEITARRAELARDQGDYARAVALFDPLVPKGDALGIVATPRLLELAGRYADVLADAGDPQEALSIDRRILGIERDLYGGLHPHVLETMLDLGSVQLVLGETAALARTRDDLTEFAPAGSTAAARARLLEADRLAAAGDETGALAAFDEAIAMLDVNLGANHPLVWGARARRAAVAVRVGDATAAAAALAALEATRAPLVAALGEKNMRLLRFDIEHARLQCERGDGDAALVTLQRLQQVAPAAVPQRERSLAAAVLADCALRRGGKENLSIAASAWALANDTVPAGMADTALGAELLALQARLARARGDAKAEQQATVVARAACERLGAIGTPGCRGLK